MASPQLEDGYARIANELLEALAAIRLAGQECQIVFAVFRKTYGFKKKSDQISHGQLAKMTGIPRVKVVRLVQSLVLKKVLGSTNNGTRKPSTIWINKDYEQWQHSPKKGTSPNKGTIASPNKGSSSSPNNGTHKRKPTKDNLQKMSGANDEKSFPPENGKPHKRIWLNCENFNWVGILESDIDAWKEAYPACIIKTELARAAEYIKANPSKKKTNWYRYITNWLNRQQNYGGTKTQQQSSQLSWAEKKDLEEKADDGSTVRAVH